MPNSIYNMKIQILLCLLLYSLCAPAQETIWTNEVGTIHPFALDARVAVGTNVAQAQFQVTYVTNFDLEAIRVENLSNDDCASVYLTLNVSDQWGFIQQFPANYGNLPFAGRLDIQQGTRGVSLDAYGANSTIQFLAGGQLAQNIAMWVSNGLVNLNTPLRLQEPSASGYTELATSSSAGSTNRLIFSLGSDTVAAGQLLRIHSTEIVAGVNQIVITNSP